MALLIIIANLNKEKNIKSKIAYLDKSVGGREGKVKRYFPRSAVTRNDVSALWSSNWIFFYHPIIANQNSLLLSVSLVRGVISLHLETQEEEKNLVYVSHLHSKTTEDWYEKRLTTYVLISAQFPLWFIFELLCLSYPLRSLNTIFL